MLDTEQDGETGL